jgi:hypothetical protein
MLCSDMAVCMPAALACSYHAPTGCVTGMHDKPEATTLAMSVFSKGCSDHFLHCCRSLGLHHLLVTPADAPVVGLLTRTDLVSDRMEVAMSDKLRWV